MQKRFYTKEDGGGFDSATTTVTRSSRSRMVFLFLFLLIGAGLVFAGVRLLSLKEEEGKKVVTTITPTPTMPVEVTTEPTPEVTEAATPSPSAKTTITPTPSKGKSTTPSRDDITIAVLNGSGKSGAASTTASSLKELGYTVSTTGNADSFTYEDIVIKVKKSKSEYLSLLKKDVGSLAIVGSSSATLSETSAVDAQVIVGK